MVKKHRKRTKSSLIAQIRASKVIPKKKFDEKIYRKEHPLSITDKLVWAYKIEKKDRKSEITEIVTVAFVTIIKNKEYTVMYYDSHHNKDLHMHLFNSIQDMTDIVIALRVRKKGNQSRLLNWALKDIRKNWYYYRRKFYKRSKLEADF